MPSKKTTLSQTLLKIAYHAGKANIEMDAEKLSKLDAKTATKTLSKLEKIVAEHALQVPPLAGDIKQVAQYKIAIDIPDDQAFTAQACTAALQQRLALMQQIQPRMSAEAALHLSEEPDKAITEPQARVLIKMGVAVGPDKPLTKAYAHYLISQKLEKKQTAKHEISVQDERENLSL